MNGCCPDVDGDGYADLACGGSDCNDSDAAIHPGALEVCGGGDMNCNGQHKPALLPAKKLTNSAAFKRELSALDVGDSIVLAWTGKPATTQHLEMLEVGWDLLAKGSVSINDDIKVNEVMPHVAIAWSPARQKFGAWWVEAELEGTNAYGPYWRSGVAWLDKNGSFDGEPSFKNAIPLCSVGLAPSLSWYATGAIARGETIIFPTERLGYNGGYPTLPPNQVSGGPIFELAATGNVSPTWGQPDCRIPGESMLQPVFLGGLISGLQYMNRASLITNRLPEVEPPAYGDIVSLDPVGTAPSTVASLAHPSRAGDCAMGDDGTLLAMTCQFNNKVYYHRATQAGGVFMTAEVLTGAQVPLSVGKSKPRPNATPTVGTALRDASGNLWFFVRDSEGAELLAPAIIGGGDAITSAQVLHDGTDFVVVWLAKTGGFEQAYAQRVTCE